MSSVSVVVAGVEYALPPLVAYDGWGMPDREIHATSGSMQDGATYRGYRLKPRIGSLVFQMRTTNYDDMDLLRLELQTLFSPINQPVLKWVMGYGERRIEAHYYADMTMPFELDHYAAQRVAVSLWCPDPLFYNPVAKSVVFALGSGAGGTPVPTPVPTPVGGSSIDDARIINYGGNYHTFPSILRITGPITDPVILHETLGKKLDFTGVTIDAGHYYDINLLFANKTVIDDTGADKLAELTRDSNQDSWMIAAHALAPGGVNQIRVTGTAVTAATKIELGWFEKFTGV